MDFIRFWRNYSISLESKVNNHLLLGYVWFPENARERKLEGKIERKKKVKKVI